jgi:hypothetical protein
LSSSILAQSYCTTHKFYRKCYKSTEKYNTSDNRGANTVGKLE